MSEFRAVVTDIREESRVAGRQRWQMALDRTEFAATDGKMLECWWQWRVAGRGWWCRCLA